MVDIGHLPFLSDRLKNESILGCFLYPFFSKIINTTKAAIIFINHSLTVNLPYGFRHGFMLRHRLWLIVVKVRRSKIDFEIAYREEELLHQAVQ